MDVEKTIEFILGSQANAEVQMQAIREMQAQAQVETAAINKTLRRAVRLGVREARSQRKRSQVLDEKITQLSAAQLVTEEKLTQLSASQLLTEEKLQKLIDSLRGGGNGSGKH
jgi:hypothetical protein